MKTNAEVLLRHLRGLRLARLNEEAEAGLLITSLPWPRATAEPLSLSGQPTFVQPLGQWPGEPESSPRRLLMIADAGASSAAPDELALTAAARPAGAPPVAEMERFAESPEEGFPWERHLLRLRFGGRSVGLAMGLRRGEEVHWWEACRLVTLEETPHCRVAEMGGAIPVVEMALADLQRHPGFSNPFLHNHNWLYGRIYARLHANGVCEIFAHHVNARFFDDGKGFDDVVPVLGVRIDGDAAEVAPLCGPWDGTCGELAVGGVRFDVTEAARLATRRQPGRIDVTPDGFLAWQPYQGFELYGGAPAKDIVNDAFIFRADKRHWPRGGARTLRFSLSLSDRSPKVARYLAPGWWYGACEELVPSPLLPVVNEYESALDRCIEWAAGTAVKGGFEDGSLPRGAKSPTYDPDAPNEPGWEGEIPHALYLAAWRTGSRAAYDTATRSAWYIADVIVDHASKMMRMHGYPPNAISPPMNRVQGMVAAYLESGDPYLIETAQAVVDATHWTHKDAWPRLGVGRDACYARGAALLYRYFADEHYLRIAREGAMAVHHAQRPNGSFSDQGGGSGIHQWGGYITKPWMGLLATMPVLDYLELAPYDPPLLETVRRFADWLMAVRFDHDGAVTWSYQHDMNGKPRHFDIYGGKWIDLPSPKQWHQENLGRLLGYCTLRFGDPAYIDAWAESRAAKKTPEAGHGDHGVSAALQYVPWVQAQLWRAQVTGSGVVARPLHFGPRTPRQGTILTPDGPVTLAWNDDGTIDATEGVTVEAAPAAVEV